MSSEPPKQLYGGVRHTVVLWMRPHISAGGCKKLKNKQRNFVYAKFSAESQIFFNLLLHHVWITWDYLINMLVKTDRKLRSSDEQKGILTILASWRAPGFNSSWVNFKDLIEQQTETLQTLSLKGTGWTSQWIVAMRRNMGFGETHQERSNIRLPEEATAAHLPPSSASCSAHVLLHYIRGSSTFPPTWQLHRQHVMSDTSTIFPSYMPQSSQPSLELCLQTPKSELSLS